MNLLIDIGNSRLKWAVDRGGAIDFGDAIAYRQLALVETLRRQWRDLPRPNRIAIASVAAKPILNDVLALAATLWPNLVPLLPQSSAYGFGVGNAYLQPSKLGVDRWLALIAARAHYSGDVCVIDCGTALTVDVLDADGRHRGGLICPGLATMQSALMANTAALQSDNGQPRPALATATEPAIANGALMAAVGVIEATAKRLAIDHRLVLTGGDAEIIGSALQVDAAVEPLLVLKGLAIACRGEVST